ncbi:MAG: hypothetical protein GY812_04915 [Actinomycetia bacterium]|nr:hypothetical protein [Actinomycetes bacterium]
MSAVVLVHGAFNELWGPHEMKARWLPSLRDGLEHHIGSIDASDVAVCFYGDLFRIDPETLDEQAWQQSRAGTSELLESFAGDGGLDVLSQAASKAAFDRTVDLVATLASNPSVADTARSRLVEAIGDGARAVVAHSLGTVLAYNTLVSEPKLSIDTLVTLGSPLGLPMTDPMLPDAGADGVRPWPEGLRRWVNVAAVGDLATGEGLLAPRFGDRVEDRRVDNGHRAHDPEPYLNNPRTGEAVMSAIS